MTTFDLSPLFRSTIGFDRMGRLLDTAARFNDAQSNYPPYNIEKAGENDYRITMAVAGFTEDDLDIVQQENSVVISGKHTASESEEQNRFLHRGIAMRAFERRFELADHIKVKGAALENGLLHVDLVREVPEAKKPRKIEIAGGTPSQVIEGETAADDKEAA
jgi:molecular chaperone IbpA